MVALSVLFCITGLVMVLVMAKLLGLDKGFAAGLMSGALTQSSIMGTATDAINGLSLDEATRKQLAHHVPIGDAVTYVFGVVAPAIFLSKLAPRLLGRDLKAECEKMEDELGGGGADPKLSGAFDAYVAVDLQAFQIDRERWTGKTVGDLEKSLPERCFIQRMRRGKKLFKPRQELPLRAGDVFVVSGHREELMKAEPLIGKNIVDPEAMEMPFETIPVIVTQKLIIGKTLQQIRETAPKSARGVHLRRITRQGLVLPRLPNTRVERGDVLELVGRPEDLEAVIPLVGYPDLPTEKSDLIFMGAACVVGILVGLLSIKIGILSVSLGSSGGILIAGLLFGWFHSVQPRFGRIPSAAVWLMETLGLNVFIVAVGLAAGPHAVEAMKSNGVQLIVAGIVVTMVPHVLTLLVGHYGFKMNLGVLLGACAGSGTATPTMQAINEESESSVPALGFTVPYALSSVLLTACGPVVVALT